ncbi:S41 family peptidase [uncultured Sphingomonas sp.]|uniref:S41 family peptidase n=1 Tax=uncultured Sphingomonas sp. TaxID=158754 RepID=UPI0035C9CD1E
MRALLLGLALTTAAGDRDWGAALRMDAAALHDDIATNHPGPLNPGDPGFARRNDAELARALRRASTARTFADYFYAMRQYVASFDDGHVEFGMFGHTPEDYRWPGFLTRYDADGEQRVFTAEERGAVPVGARLIGCDGKTAEQVSAELVGSIVGRWSLLSQRHLFGSWTFTNTANPYVMRPARCSFDVGGTTRTVDLDWRAADPSALLAKTALQSMPRSVGRRVLADRTQWLDLPSFNGDPGSEPGRQLTALLNDIDSRREELAKAPRIVLDLRGNGGGSSDWSYQIARRLWGDGTIAAAPASKVTVTWRASAANLETIRSAFRERTTGGALSSESRQWFERTIKGLSAALAADKATWTEPTKAAPRPIQLTPTRPELGGRVYLVTDSSCMSACLDAVDLWRALGAIHAGQETSADTLYMETRSDRLPSGLGSISVPMKVYHGRPRGSNEPVRPQREFPGDIADTPALEAWITALS